MYLAKLYWKHDCILGRRAEKFKVKVAGFPMDFYKDGKYVYYSHFERLFGKDEDIKEFIADLKIDKRIKEFQQYGSTVFFSYRMDKKVPTTNYYKKVFFLKPVVVDKEGVEHWEVASWKKQHLNEFISKTKNDIQGLEFFKVESIKKASLDDIYFFQFSPKLSEKQKKAMELAVENGYFDFPKKIELKQLAEKMGVSLSTYREHLRIAQKKVMPNIAKS